MRANSRTIEAGTAELPPEQNFRFFDNRQKYLMFVNTCSEKWVVASRVNLELASIHPRPPAVRLFDAGVGDGTVLSRVLRAMHKRFPWMPHYVVAKEISLEDIRLTLEKMPDRFFEHPSTVLVLTNLYYSEAPWLTTHSVSAATSMVWKEVALQGSTSAEFEDQVTELQPFLARDWRARISPKSGNPVYEKPVVLILYREDQRFLLDSVIPRRGAAAADFDLVIASQPYRARASTRFKAEKVVAPLTRALRPGGRLIGIHSYGEDPGLEIIRRIWPDEDPFVTPRHLLITELERELNGQATGGAGSPAGPYGFDGTSDAGALFTYHLHAMPNEVSNRIGTSTALAAWNAAVYVAQIEDERIASVLSSPRYLDVTVEVVRKHGGLWFQDESFVVVRNDG